MNHIAAIDKSIKEKLTHREIVRKVYLTYPTKAFIEREEQQYEIFNEISSHFSIPINHIQVCGSSKMGRSFHKDSQFTPKSSDLDIAIIDTALFLKYSEIIFNATNGFNDCTKFTGKKGENNFLNYSSYIAKGIFRPDYMASCKERAEWFNFFNQLSLKYKDYFKSINAGIYLSQVYFEHKQSSNIRYYIKSKI
ncbi:hypothetical protein M2459_000214 [Parabacteroides sp. PF5-5]|uniref:hypothetical protein n=1 Tax=unclassified Parabacteroides TaxID=2649774 RepID=UPI002472F834|nr:MULTISPECIES: hypothetical protein [unclassified Parabacteroides]MDH6303882.1 hypothetical protein [Parabacteroides sp. PH5-39]MDH6314499.1 hypothetical protein [Parabacteroides sp. PF5-13]MDH6318436.1 hypothetical protein [Parabacteroides sp. PH5-13]MDH6322271.1 hypothetical protein [Parabacteroides sp. PH5-8]MDH6325649.1 hypothetical protein [Parabacteroides sp. PH5-41]